MAGGAALALALFWSAGPVRADAPERAPAAKAAPAKPQAGKTTTAAGTATPQDTISPRWIGPKWEIKGLTVWVFTPGHFEGR